MKWMNLKNSKRREAVITSASKIVLRLSNTFAAQMLAIVLMLFDYDQTLQIQSEKTLIGIECSLTVIPGILFLTGALLVKLYPLSEKKHARIVKVLQRRKINGSYVHKR